MNEITNQVAEDVETKHPNQPEIGQNVRDVLIKTEEGKQPVVSTDSNTKDNQAVESMQKTEEPKQTTGKFGGFSFSNAQGNSGNMGNGARFGFESLKNRV